jgi:hypothetical protein
VLNVSGCTEGREGKREKDCGEEEDSERKENREEKGRNGERDMKRRYSRGNSAERQTDGDKKKERKYEEKV